MKAALLLCLVLCGCSAAVQIPPQPAVIAAPVEDDHPRAICLVRARLFKGLVGVPCADLAQEFKP